MATRAELYAEKAYTVMRGYLIMEGSTAYPTWNTAPAWLKDIMVKTVIFWGTSKNATVEQVYAARLKARYEGGWRYAETFDAATKLDPNMVLYKNLSALEKRKEKLLIAVIELYLEENDNLFEELP